MRSDAGSLAGKMCDRMLVPWQARYLRYERSGAGSFAGKMPALQMAPSLIDQTYPIARNSFAGGVAD
ncbi:hypothetical protein [Egbenema bharatensis]|uniref:hypothetical protein n=1 Tax=Egbenema bharatensis TaxID=3463334 RepID=UPI003A871C32